MLWVSLTRELMGQLANVYLSSAVLKIRMENVGPTRPNHAVQLEQWPHQHAVLIKLEPANLETTTVLSCFIHLNQRQGTLSTTTENEYPLNY